MRRIDVVEAMTVQRRATVNLLRSLDEGDWEVPSLPGWRVRDVVAHLLATDEAVCTLRALPLLVTGDRGHDERPAESAWATRSSEDLVDELERLGVRLQRLVRALPPAVHRMRVSSPYGRMRVGTLVAIRVLDEWVHTWDVARSTSREAPCPPAVQAVVATAALERLPVTALPQVPRSAGVVRLQVRLEGAGVAGLRWAADFARRHYGARVTAPPDAEVTLTATDLALLSERRIPWEEAAGTIDGDAELAHDVLQAIGGRQPPAARTDVA